MTHTTNARIAGFTFLFYIAAGITSLVLSSQATGGQEVPAKLASIAQHVLQLRLTIVLGLLQAVCAIVLAVTLYAITRDQDSDLAMLALIFRVGEGLLNAVSTRDTLELLWLGTSAGPKAPDGDIAGARQVPSRWARLEYDRNLVRDGQHSLLVSVPPGPDNPGSNGVARRCCLGPSRRRPSSATCWFFERPGHVIHVDTNGCV